MTIELGQWHNILPILRETHKIWSPGLNKSHYYHYIYNQLQMKNYRFIVFHSNGNVVAGCKLYSITAYSHGKTYNFAAIGAVYVLESYREQSFGKKLIKKVIDMAHKENFDAVYLFTDIGSHYYEQFGFEKFSSKEIRIYLTPNQDQTNNKVKEITTIQSVNLSDIPSLEKYYRRWLARQKYGIERSHSYWHFKIGRELYLHKNSSWKWPQPQIIWAHDGYALVEQGDDTLRVFEVIGNFNTQAFLWEKLLTHAISANLHRIRGWEALLQQKPPKSLGKVHLVERSWGTPMILPLNSEIVSCPYVSQCGWLELDYL